MTDADTDTDVPADKIELYLKVSALAAQGAPGEKEQAERTLARLRLKYPGIEFLAEEQIRATRKSSRREPEPPPNAPKQAFWSAYTRTFESVTRILSDISEILADVNAESDAHAAIDDALTATGRTVKVKGEEKFRLIVDIDAAVLGDALATLEDEQVEALARHVGGRIAEALAATFLGEDDEDDDEEDE